MKRSRERRRSSRALNSNNDYYGEEHTSSRARINRSKFDDDHSHHGSPRSSKQVWKGNSEYHRSKHGLGEWRGSYHSRITFSDQHSIADDEERTVHGKFSNGKPSTLPAKYLLELVLDTLQRRDIYEIFAEPVDPDEVKNYYEIIKEPMDFGTMRAKLHEGMYANLEQFEHDALLIPENAMYFNSSTTIYFRQGSAIHELAKKVFHLLKTNPEKLVSEFSGTTRRTTRKATRSHTMKDSARKCYNRSCSSKRKNTTSCLSGGRKLSYEASKSDKKPFTYLSSTSSNSYIPTINDLSVGFNTFIKSQLMLNENGDKIYKDSLMSFIEDLGPTARMVALKKLVSVQPKDGKMANRACTTTHSFPTSSLGNGLTPLFKPASIQERTHDHRLQVANNLFISKTLKNNVKIRSKDEANKGEVVIRKPFLDLVDGRGSNPSSKMEHEDRSYARLPVILALENSHSKCLVVKDSARYNKFSNKTRSSRSSDPDPAASSADGTMPLALPAAALAADSLHDKKAKSMHLTPQFVFDIPFLQARLNQMQGFLN